MFLEEFEYYLNFYDGSDEFEKDNIKVIDRQGYITKEFNKKAFEVFGKYVNFKVFPVGCVGDGKVWVDEDVDGLVRDLQPHHVVMLSRLGFKTDQSGLFILITKDKIIE